MGRGKKKLFVCCSSQPFIFEETLFKQAKIVAIEPDPHIFKILNSNIHSSNLKDVKLCNMALSNKKGVSMFFHEGSDGGRVHDMTNSKSVYEVETVILDELIDRKVDFLTSTLTNIFHQNRCHFEEETFAQLLTPSTAPEAKK